MSDSGFFDSLATAVQKFMVTLAEDSMQATEPDLTLVPGQSSDRLGSAFVPMAPADTHAGIGAIRESDPAFDLSAFLTHVGEMFSAYHAALDKGDLTPARRFVDETAYIGLETAARATGRSAAGPRQLTVRAIRPVTARHEDGMDLVRVLITADVAGSDEPVCEYWELIRKQGTLTKPGLTITRCPNCGGPVDGLDPTRCAYCGTRLADPALDWVVRKIAAQ